MDVKGYNQNNDLQQLTKNHCVVYKIVSPEIFVEKFNDAQKRTSFSECVVTHTADECRDMKCLCSKNGFVSVESDGNITAVLRNRNIPQAENEKKYFLRDLLANAKTNGGDKLDCFAIIRKNADGSINAGLADMYAKHGFVPVCRDKFNKEFAPDGWNYEKNGEPDVVFMYNDDSVEKMLENSTKSKYPSYVDYLKAGKVPYIQDLPSYDPEKSSYDQALAYRDRVMNENKAQMGNAVRQSDISCISNISDKDFIDEDTDNITKK